MTNTIQEVCVPDKQSFKRKWSDAIKQDYRTVYDTISELGVQSAYKKISGAPAHGNLNPDITDYLPLCKAVISNEATHLLVPVWPFEKESWGYVLPTHEGKDGWQLTCNFICAHKLLNSNGFKQPRRSGAMKNLGESGLLADWDEAEILLETERYYDNITDFDLFSQTNTKQLVKQLVEGSKEQRLVTMRKRNAQVRRLVIDHYGAICWVCGFNSTDTYGPQFKGIIDVHHLHPLSGSNGEHTFDPIETMRPLCPNCHAVITRKRCSIEEIIESFHTMAGNTSKLSIDVVGLNALINQAIKS